MQMTQSYIKMTHSYIKMKHSYIKMILASYTFLVLQQHQNLGRRFGTSKMLLSPHPWLRLLSEGGGSVVVDSLFIVTPIVGVCICSMF